MKKYALLLSALYLTTAFLSAYANEEEEKKQILRLSLPKEGIKRSSALEEFTTPGGLGINLPISSSTTLYGAPGVGFIPGEVGAILKSEDGTKVNPYYKKVGEKHEVGVKMDVNCSIQ